MTKQSFKRLLSLFIILTLVITGTVWPGPVEVSAASRSPVVLNLSDSSIVITDTYYQIGDVKYDGNFDYVNKANTCLRPQVNVTPGRYDHELNIILTNVVFYVKHLIKKVAMLL